MSECWKCKLGLHEDYDDEKLMMKRYCTRCGHKTDFTLYGIWNGG